MKLLVTVLVLVVQLGAWAQVDESTNDMVNLSSAEIARLRGYEAEEHYVTGDDNYRINVVRIKPVRPNPNKRPVIFNHGSTQSSTYFMTNSVGARPRDYSQLNAASMSSQNLTRLLAKDRTKTCLPLLLASFGYEVWLINRRGTEFSLGYGNKRANGSRVARADDESDTSGLLSNLTSSLESYLGILSRPQLNLDSLANTLDVKYWNYSFDEQAKFDLPAILRYVLEFTKSPKVAYVGHSFGNGLMFMLQSQEPQWADKVEPFLAWSPDFYLAHTTSILYPLIAALEPVLFAVPTPFPPTPITPLTRTLLASLCQTRLNQETVCRLLENAMWGFSGNQTLTKPAFVASQFYSVSSREGVQFAQAAQKGKMHFLDLGPIGNKVRYGQLAAPIYNVSRIISKSISFWRGREDALATPADVATLISDFSVDIDDRLISEVPFNHYDFLFGRDTAEQVIIPSLRLIESYAGQ